MSTPPEDPRVRPPRQNRKEKSIVRVGYPMDSRDKNHITRQQDTPKLTMAPSARQHLITQTTPLQKIKDDTQA